MQSFELLGGKYQQGEQILPGVIQTFRSYEVPTGRPVFIHRILNSDPAAQEIAGLLSAGLIRSAVVRKMLLDVYENEPYRFVVTEPARQCVPLRDWLEREADETPEAAAEPQSEPTPDASELAFEEAENTPPAKPVKEPEVKPMEPSPDAEGSEFARLFHEALSGKLERSRRGAAAQSAAPSTGKPPIEPEAQESKPAANPHMSLVSGGPAAAPAATLGPTPDAGPPLATEPELFSKAAEAEAAGRSTLIIILTVLAVLVALLVMFVFIFLKR